MKKSLTQTIESVGIVQGNLLHVVLSVCPIILFPPLIFFNSDHFPIIFLNLRSNYLDEVQEAMSNDITSEMNLGFLPKNSVSLSHP